MLRTHVFRLALLAVLVHSPYAAGTSTCAADPLDDVEKTAAKRLVELVKERNFSAIEDELNDKLRRYRQSQFSDRKLINDLDHVAAAGNALEPLLLEWTNTRPNSYFAHLTRGMHQIAQGYAKRGKKFSGETSTEQFQAMEAELEKAQQSLSRAAELDADSGLTFAAMMPIAKALGTAESTLRLLAEANRRDRRSVAVRERAIFALNPKWGGSFEILDAVIAQASSAGVPAPELRRLQYQAEMEKANFHRASSKRLTDAISHWLRANAICPSSRALWWASGAAYELEDWRSVRSMVNSYLVLRPTDAYAHVRRGWASESLGDMPSAIKDYQYAANQGDSWALNKLGHLHRIGQFVPKDLKKARELFELASAKGNATAKENLEILNRASASP